MPTRPWSREEINQYVRVREGMLDQIPAAHRERAALLSVVGSTAHGISVSQEGPEGDDLDLAGMYVPPRDQVLGMQDAKTIVWRSKPEGERSEAGDVDFTIHPLRKFVKLAYGGNPTILAILFSPDVPIETEVGRVLRQCAKLFATQRAGQAFQGYAEAQYQRLRGQRGQRNVKRPELIEAHGFDVKYAAHVLRLCWQGCTLLYTGEMPMPLIGAQRETVLAIRRGEVSEDDALEQIAEARAALEGAMFDTSLPKEPDFGEVNALLVRLHEMSWNE